MKATILTNHILTTCFLFMNFSKSVHILLRKIRCFFNVIFRGAVLEWSRKSGVFNVEVTTQQTNEILQTLVLDDEIVEVKSTGFGDFSSVPIGRISYRCKSKGGNR